MSMPSSPPEQLQLRAQRLLLRPLRPADAAALFGIFSDPQTLRYWSSSPWTTMAQADAMIASARIAQEDGSALRFGLEIAASGELIGNCTLYHFSPSNRRCEVGYILGRGHWGKGYMAEAMARLLAHAFDALDLNRIEADIDPRNAASARLLERLGFRKEGFMRERWIVNGEICDTDYYGLLRAEWRDADGKRQQEQTGKREQ
ncbi:MAG TPA: GNAT family protein [Janthinobacterium sp.]|nr:GNAT family protein [Janthinobacterium sp.]